MTSNLTYSIFYDKADWYKLISHLHVFFFKEGINYFFIKLSIQEGDHIEFTINVNDNLKILLAKKASYIIKNFIKENPSNSLLSNPNKKSYYLDFPINTLHYGIHDYFPPDLYLDETIKKNHFEITKIIILIFEEYKDETLSSMTEIVLQIFIIYAQYSKKNIHQLIVFFKELFNNEILKYDETILKNEEIRVIEEFEQNKEILTIYLDDSILKGVNFPKNGWEKHLFNLFKASERNSSYTPEHILKTIISNIGYSKLTSYIFIIEGLKILKTQSL